MFSSIFFLLPLAAFARHGHFSLVEKRDTCAPPAVTKFCALFGDPHLTTFNHNVNPTDIDYFLVDKSADITGLVRTKGTSSYSLFKGQALSTIIEVNFKVYNTPDAGVTDLQRVSVVQKDAFTKAVLNSIVFKVRPRQLGTLAARVVIEGPHDQWLPSRVSQDGHFTYYDFFANNVRVGSFGVGASSAGLNFGMNIIADKFDLDTASGACTLDITALNVKVPATPQTFPVLY